jgi:hypothetical protein
MGKQFITEAQRLQKLAGIITENLDDKQAIGFLFHPEEDEYGDIEYIFDKDKLIDVIKSLGYDDAEEIAKEIMTISSPEDELEIMRNKMRDPDLQITDLTVGMIKQGIKIELEEFNPNPGEEGFDFED